MALLLIVQTIQYLVIIHVLSYTYYTTSHGDIITKYHYIIRVVVQSMAMIVVALLYFLEFEVLFVIQFVLVHVVVAIHILKDRK